MQKVKDFIIKKKVLYSIVIVLIIFLAVFLFRNNKTNEGTFVVHYGDFVNQASVSGKVVPASSVDLGFKMGGRIDKIYYTVGQRVLKGQVIASLDSADVRGSYETAKANYQKVLNGATNEDIAVAKSSVEIAQTALDQAKSVEELAVFNAKKNLLNSGFIVTTDDLSTQTPPTISGTYLKDQEGQINITSYSSSGGTAFKTTGLVESSGVVSADIPQPIGDTGLYIKFSSTINDATKWILNIPNKLSPAYLTNLNAYNAALNTEKQVIANATAQLNQAKSALLLKQSAARPEDIDAASGALIAAEGALNDRIIYAPFDGMITRMDAKVGEIASPNVPVIALISNGTFQIESFVPEVKIAQIKLNDVASITLDAYGETVTFSAKVVSIDPAETIKDGVSTYKVKLQFDNADDRIKSGMTANVLITTESKPNTIVIPEGMIFEKNGSKFVQITKDKKVNDIEVKTGSKTSLGQVEILSGLKEGDVILLNPKVN